MIDPAYLPPEWTKLALCAQVDTELFYPERGDSYSAEMARKVCYNCEVRQQCLDYALDNNEKYGIWGGTNEIDRRDLPKTKRLAC
jgi:WhiB family redox-sensing transcriptional regulator